MTNSTRYLVAERRARLDYAARSRARIVYGDRGAHRRQAERHARKAWQIGLRLAFAVALEA